MSEALYTCEEENGCKTYQWTAYGSNLVRKHAEYFAMIVKEYQEAGIPVSRNNIEILGTNEQKEKVIDAYELMKIFPQCRGREPIFYSHMDDVVNGFFENIPWLNYTWCSDIEGNTISIYSNNEALTYLSEVKAEYIKVKQSKNQKLNELEQGYLDAVSLIPTIKHEHNEILQAKGKTSSNRIPPEKIKEFITELENIKGPCSNDNACEVKNLTIAVLNAYNKTTEAEQNSENIDADRTLIYTGSLTPIIRKGIKQFEQRDTLTQ